MFIRKNLGASLMTRDVACATYPPGSTQWMNWGCGAVAPPVPAPAQIVVPPSAPMPQDTYVHAPAPAPVQQIIQVDNAAGQRADQEYNARIAAESRAADAARAQAAADAAAAKARGESDMLRAQLTASANSGGSYEPGSVYGGPAGPSKTTGPAQSESGNGLLIAAVLAAGIAFAVKGKRK